MHFTYSEERDLNNLKQGDVLNRTQGLVEAIEKIQPDFACENIFYYQVLTQTCDLSRDKSPYITIAPVKSLDYVVQEVISEFKEKTTFSGKLFCSDKNKSALTEFLRKLFNNNNSNYFFLKSDLENELERDCCTFLRTSISLDKEKYLQACLDAKIAELDENFRAKLGWQVGNLYSRVGTKDFVPTFLPNEKAFTDHINEQMDSFVGWVEKADYSLFKQKAGSASSLDEVYESIKRDKDLQREQQLNALIKTISNQVALDPTQIESIRNVLSQNPLIKKALPS